VAVFRAEFVLEGFTPRSAESVEALGAMAAGLVQVNLSYLRNHPETPKLYALAKQGRVRYQPEPIGKEEWCNIPQVIKQGWGDCEDLAAFRCAELISRGVLAVPNISWRADGPQTIYHVTVLIGIRKQDKNSYIEEDPSKILGMRGED